MPESVDEEGFLKKVLAFGPRGVGSIGQAALEQGLRHGDMDHSGLVWLRRSLGSSGGLWWDGLSFKSPCAEEKRLT